MMAPKETIYPSAAATLNLLWRSLKDLTTSPTDSLPWCSNYHGNIGGAGELTYYGPCQHLKLHDAFDSTKFCDIMRDLPQLQICGRSTRCV